MTTTSNTAVSRGRRVLEHLCETIGPRWAGTAAEHAAAEFLAEELRDLGLQVTKTPVRYIGWEPLDGSFLHVWAPERLDVPICPYYYSAPTRASPVSGWFQAAGRAVMGLYEGRDVDADGPPAAPGGPEKFAIIGPREEVVGYVVCGGLEIPRPGGFTQYADPVVLAGKVLTDRIALWKVAGTPVGARLHVAARYRPDAVSYNVIGELPGESSRCLILGAHYDSLYHTPGAFDNGSGVMALIEAAGALAGRRLPLTVRFCLFGAEELDFQGSRHYVLSLKERGELAQVAAMVNLDAVGNPAGERRRFHNFRVTDDALGGLVEKALQQFRIAERYGWEDVLSPFPWRRVLYSRGSDYCFFAQEGVPAISCGANGAIHGHTPEDTIENMDPEVSALKGQMAAWMVEQLAARLAP